MKQTPTTCARLLTFSFGALAKPGKEETKDPSQPSLATKIKNQVDEYTERTVLIDFSPNRARNLRRKGENGEGEQLRRRIATKFVDGDVRGAVRVLTSEDGFADRSKAIVDALREKHPPAPSDLDLPPPPDDQLASPITVTKQEVLAGIMSFPKSSGTGPDGLRHGHLRDLVGRSTAASGDRLLIELTAFINMTLRGEVPGFALPIFYGASLIAIKKKDEGIRPIAVGNTLRRLAAKVGLQLLSEALGKELRPVQLGFGTLGGCEAAVHAARKYINGTRERRVFIKIDMRNAFNSIRRDTILSVARERIPRLYPLLWQAYARPSALLFGENVISSATGLQQGDPCGPALFSLGVDEPVRSINSELSIWFLDGSRGGPVEDVLADITTVTVELARRGLDVNDAKCELVLINHQQKEVPRTLYQFRNILPNIRVLQEDNYQLLGAPLSSEAVGPALRAKEEALKRMADRLLHIEPHPALVPLKNCFAVPRLQYLLRTSAAYEDTRGLRAIDTAIQESVARIVNVQFHQDAWTQATLPVSLGGLGVRMSEDIALPSFISSLHATAPLVEHILLKTTGLREITELVDATNTLRWKYCVG